MKIPSVFFFVRIFVISLFSILATLFSCIFLLSWWLVCLEFFFLLIHIMLIGVDFLSYFSRWLLKLLTTAHTICVNFAATIFDLSKQLPIFLLSTFVACFGEKLVDCGLLKNLLSHLSMLLWLRQHFGLVEITIHPIYWWNYFHKNSTKIIIFDFFET